MELDEPTMEECHNHGGGNWKGEIERDGQTELGDVVLLKVGRGLRMRRYRQVITSFTYLKKKNIFFILYI